MIRLDRLRPQSDSRLAFLQGFLRKPQQVGSIIPSSRFLERRIIQLAGVRTARTVVELGPGTGGTTRAILSALPVHARLLCVEINPRFVSVLERTKDARLAVHMGSAEDLGSILSGHGLSSPEAVVSGIPFSTMSLSLGRGIIEVVRSVLAPGGRFVAYQVRDRVAELGRDVFGPAERQVELRNIPPVRVYRWQKPSGPVPDPEQPSPRSG
jgi:phosphatidylethanolamine/phosphatidyl-N-methylethanolamine N-methyltransferase